MQERVQFLGVSCKTIFPQMVTGFYHGLARFTPRELHEVRIRNGLLAGRSFLCHLNSERPYWLGNWELDAQRTLRELLKPGMVVYNIGMHKGFFSLLAAQLVQPHGRVLGFEPDTATRIIAQRNLALNPDLADSIDIYGFAISDATGSERFIEAGNERFLSRLARNVDISNDMLTLVTTTTVDDFIAQGHPVPDLIQMDIEGGEAFAFQGMTNTLSVVRPVVLVEIHDGPCWEAFLQVLRTFRYQARRVSDDDLSDRPCWAGRDQYVAIPITGE